MPWSRTMRIRAGRRIASRRCDNLATDSVGYCWLGTSPAKMREMSAEDLEGLLLELNSIAAADVDTPDIPMPTVLQEAHDLATYVAQDDVRGRLLAVGAEAEDLDLFPTAVGAAREAQSRWAVVRDGAKPEAQQEREATGRETRSTLIASCRWNLRRSRPAQSALDAIAEGDGIEDLIQDLEDLAALIEGNRAGFEQDQTFDVSAQVEGARSLASDIRTGLTALRTTEERPRILDQRDRAFTFLDDLVSDIREAGRYAFRLEPNRLRHFSSSYLKRRRRRAANRPQPPVPVDPSSNP